MTELEFQDQLWRLIDGDLSHEEFSELENHLASHPEARSQLIEHIELHNILDLRLSTVALAGTPWEGVVAVDQLLVRQRHRAVRYSAMGAAAILLIVGAILAFVLAPSTPPIVTFRASEGSIWNIEHGEGQAPETSQTLATGSRLTLRQGSVEITTTLGVTARVKAPADLTVLTENEIRQDLGVIHYRVPKEAVGFQVQTPQLQIKDLGTAFGVISRPGKPDEVHLFKGSVEVRLRKGNSESTVMTNAQAMVVGTTGTLEPTDLRPHEFIRELTESIPYLHFPFNSVRGTEVPVSGNSEELEEIKAWLETPGFHVGKDILTDGKFGRALRLTGNGEFVQTNWPGIEGRNPRTVAFWLRLPKDAKPERFQGILVWGDTRDSAGKFSVNWNFIRQSGNLGALRLNASVGNVVGETDLRDGRWHHIAVVLGGDTRADNEMGVTLYVDGVEERQSGTRSGEPDTVLGHNEDSWLSIGRFFDVDVPARGTLRGDIDELYIFSGALTAESIRNLMVEGWNR